VQLAQHGEHALADRRVHLRDGRIAAIEAGRRTGVASAAAAEAPAGSVAAR
jgi:hypothetical protein